MEDNFWVPTEWRIIFGFLTFFGVPEIPDIFLVNGRSWAQAYVYIKH